MKAHTKEQFNEFIAQLKETNATLDFFCNFDKISSNVEKISVKLHQLNYLIGKEDLPAAVRELWEENRNVFSVLDILIAIRKKEKKKVIDKAGNFQLVESYFDSEEGVIEFITKTGLENIFKDKKITNLVDYVFGVETGLDTNARKNRSGTQMGNAIAEILRNAGITFTTEVYSDIYKELDVLGEDKKRFDFVIETPAKKYMIEVNFYSAGGSKLNEVARSYSELALKINAVKGFEFIWITDGKGWEEAKNKLEEAFYKIPKIYNMTTIKELITIIKKETGYGL